MLLEDRLEKGRKRLDQAVEDLALLCEPVEPPRGDLEHIHYFCGNTEIATDLVEREPQRSALYKATAGLVRSYANLADELDAAGYSAAEVSRLKQQVDRYRKLRDIIKMASGEHLDLKAYEADMRHLIDTYIEADEPRTISPFGDMGLLELITKTGIDEAIANRIGDLKGNHDAVAETIENNVRSTIVRDQLTDPAFYAKMSALLDEIIEARKQKALEYEEYLKQIAELAKHVDEGVAEDTPEQLKSSPALRALYNNLQPPEGDANDAGRLAEAAAGDAAPPDSVIELALRIDESVREVRPDDWKGHQPSEQVIKQALFAILGDEDEVERIFLVIKAQDEY